MAYSLLNMSPSLRGSATLSEISSDRGSSIGDVREEMQNLANSLGVDINDLYKVRFKVDRKKLESMIGIDPSSTEVYFEKIIKETNTLIKWPKKLKIGAKSNRDPHVTIIGRQKDVKSAKEKVLVDLESRVNRITMKMDVSYTDHSHVIGKGGLSIKQVMDETLCHIHFPDSNRSNAYEKSNQVSICGDIIGVELARARIRNLIPLIFCFELPILNTDIAQPDQNSPIVVEISEQYNVQVIFRTQPKLHETLVMVKGCELEYEQVKTATIILIKKLCGSLHNQIQIQVNLEIAPLNHPVVLGKDNANLKNIMQRTNTKIMFPDANDPNIPVLKKSHITIIGDIKNVYIARQLLIGSLPLVIIFDLPEMHQNIKTERINQLMNKLDVFINIRSKPKQNTLTAIVKGIERNIKKIYEARYELLSSNEGRIVPQIPLSYYFENASLFLNNSNEKPSSQQQASVVKQSTTTGLTYAQQLRSKIEKHKQNTKNNNEQQTNNNNENNNSMNISSRQNVFPPPGFSTLPQCSITPQIVLSNYTPQTNSNYLNTYMQNSNLHNLLQQNILSNNLINNTTMLNPLINNAAIMNNANILNNTSLLSPPTIMNNFTTMLNNCQNNQQNNLNSILTNSLNNSQSLMNSSHNSSLMNFLSASVNSNSSLLNLSENSSNNLMANSINSSDSGFVSSHINDSLTSTRTGSKRRRNSSSSSLGNEDINAVLSEMNKNERPNNSPLHTMSLEERRLAAHDAVRSTISGYRVPNDTWSGFGLSSTMPIPSNDFTLNNSISSDLDDDVWITSPKNTESIHFNTPESSSSKTVSSSVCQRLNSSNLLDHTPTHSLNHIQKTNWKDISTLLTSVGLEKYVRLFLSNEVDLVTFQSLNDNDLTELGVKTFGARKKMLLIIAELNKRKHLFSPAPGSERKRQQIESNNTGNF